MSRLVFLDFETTGLDPAAGAEPIELAAIVTDDAFNVLGVYETLIRPSPKAAWADSVLRMHEQSGLFGLCLGGGRSLGAVEADLAQLLVPYAGQTLHLAGNSVHFDRAFLKFYWPNIERTFHHRHLDVSAIRMLGERVTSAPGLPGPAPHRALADVRRSLEELRYWADAFRRSTP